MGLIFSGDRYPGLLQESPQCPRETKDTVLSSPVCLRAMA